MSDNVWLKKLFLLCIVRQSICILFTLWFDISAHIHIDDTDFKNDTEAPRFPQRFINYGANYKTYDNMINQ